MSMDPEPTDPWAEEVLEALPLQDNILTNQLIVDNVNEIKQPIMYEYISDNEEDTQGVLSLNINGARVLSEYTNATPITQNGVHEFDVVDSNINMPVMNYKVNVNVPTPNVYEIPPYYTTKRITSSNNYFIYDFVNANLTNYQFVDKSIPVVIDVSPGFSVAKITIAGDTIANNNTNTNWTFYSAATSVTVSTGKEIVSVEYSSAENGYFIEYNLNLPSGGKTYQCAKNSWVYIYSKTSQAAQAGPLDFYDSSNNKLFTLYDMKSDIYEGRVFFPTGNINFDGINWMTFD